MARIEVETLIDAPPATVFDLARDIELHCQTASHTCERAIDGVTSGLIGLGDSVTFEGVHLGLRRRLTARIIEFEPPHRFVDEMTRGSFKSLTHIHEFEPIGDGTLMRDTLIWTAPFGLLGVVVDKLILLRHMRQFLLIRNAKLKEFAEHA